MVGGSPCRVGNCGDNGGGIVVKDPRQVRSGGSEKMPEKGLIERADTVV